MIVQRNEKVEKKAKKTPKNKDKEEKKQDFMGARRLVRSLNVARHCGRIFMYTQTQRIKLNNA